MSGFFSPPTRILPLLEDLSVHAVGIHFWHIVSIFCCQLTGRVCWQQSVMTCQQTKQPLMVCLSMFGHILYLFIHCGVCSDLQGTGGRRLCVTIEPALLLKGDIMVSSHGKEMTTRGTLIWVKSYSGLPNF